MQRIAVFLSLDLALLTPALLLCFALQPLLASPADMLVMMSPVLPYLVMGTAAMSLWLGLPSIRLNAFDEHALGHTAVLALTVSGLSAVLGVWSTPDVPMGTHAIFGICYFLLLVACRLALFRVVTGLYRSALPRCRVLIYGAGATGTQIASALRTHDGIDPIAFVDDNTSLQGVRIMGLPVHPPARLHEIVKTRGINRVLLAMPSLTQPKQAQIAARLQALGLEVQAMPSFAQLIGEDGLLDKMAPVAPQEFLARAAHHEHLGTPREAYRDKVVLVSGAGGSIGSELCRQLLACAPKRLVLYELNEFALYTVHQELSQLNDAHAVALVPVLGSVTDPRQVRKVLADHDVEVVLHAAAYKHVPLVEANPLAGLANNVMGTQTLARAAADAGVERFILISSDKAVRPTNVMGASKRLAELVVQDLSTRHNGTVFTMVRFGNVLGSSGSVVPLFQDQVRRGGPVTVTDPNVMRYFMTIREAVQLVLKAGDAAQGGEVFVLDMGEPVSILRLARQVIESAGYSVRDATHPDGDVEIKITGLRPGEKLEEELTLSEGLIRTRHTKIFCAQEDTLSEIEVASALRGLRHAMASGDDQAAHAVIARWVEGDGMQANQQRVSTPPA
ncbi:MAG: polysaccharide biosynthesis protein [Paracoccaceae bacterium]